MCRKRNAGGSRCGGRRGIVRGWSIRGGAKLWQWNLVQAGGRAKGFSHPQTPERAGPFGQTQGRQARPLQGEADVGVLFAEMEAENAIGIALREIDAPDYTREQKLRYE